MKKEDLFEAIGDVGEDLIRRADRKPRRTPVILRYAALAACCALVLGAAAVVVPMFRCKSAAPEAAAPAATAAADSVMEEAALAEEPAEEEAPAACEPEAPMEEFKHEKGEAFVSDCIGPLHLDMTPEEVLKVVQTKPEVQTASDSAYDYESWFYQLTEDPDRLYDLQLLFIHGAEEENSHLARIFVCNDLDWSTPEGIGVGSEETELLNIYPEASILTSNGDNGCSYAVEADDHVLTLQVENGIVTTLTLEKTMTYAEP